jgi:hypothetical protein
MIRATSGAKVVEFVGNAMMQHGGDERIAQQHFIDAACRRVAVERGFHVGVEQAADFGQALDKGREDAVHLALDGLVAVLRIAVVQFHPHLRGQQRNGRLQGGGHEDVLVGGGHFSRAEAERKQRGGQHIDDAAQRMTRRKTHRAIIAAHPPVLAPALAHVAQAGDDALDVERILCVERAPGKFDVCLAHELSILALWGLALPGLPRPDDPGACAALYRMAAARAKGAGVSVLSRQDHQNARKIRVGTGLS